MIKNCQCLGVYQVNKNILQIFDYYVLEKYILQNFEIISLKIDHLRKSANTNMKTIKQMKMLEKFILLFLFNLETLVSRFRL